MIADFYKNKAQREAVKQYIEDYFRKEAVDMVFARKDVSHVADAMELLDSAFSQMEVDYGIKKKINNVNGAR